MDKKKFTGRWTVERAISEVGRPLGVYALDAGFRKVSSKASECDEEGGKESERWLAGLTRAHELSEAYPDTRVITVCDWEADLWSMLRQAVVSGDSLLVRSNGARKRKVILEDGTAEKLPLHLSKQPVIVHKTIQVEACGGKRKRKAWLDLRACMMTLGQWHSFSKKSHSFNSSVFPAYSDSK